MKREDIETAAKKEAENLACLVYYGGSAISQEDVENAFVKGAEWRIESVWHDSQEKPALNEFFVYQTVDEEWETDCLYKDTIRWDVYAVSQRLIRWAYIKDLIPNTEK